MAMVSAERRLGHVFRVDTDLMVPGPKVQLREEAGTVQLVQ